MLHSDSSRDSDSVSENAGFDDCMGFVSRVQVNYFIYASICHRLILSKHWPWAGMFDAIIFRICCHTEI